MLDHAQDTFERHAVSVKTNSKILHGDIETSKGEIYEPFTHLWGDLENPFDAVWPKEGFGIPPEPVIVEYDYEGDEDLPSDLDHSKPDNTARESRRLANIVMPEKPPMTSYGLLALKKEAREAETAKSGTEAELGQSR